MNVTELRIGNYLERYGKIVKIVEIGIKHKVDTNYYLRCDRDNSGYWLNQFKPIELTEEILLECGFEKIGEWHFIKDDKYKLEETIEDGVFIFRLQTSLNDSVCLKYIKHLHQLQNLYYALTNQELNINI